MYLYRLPGSSESMESAIALALAFADPPLFRTGVEGAELLE